MVGFGFGIAVVYIFGGYGGLGYSRRDLDDLYALVLFSII